MRCKIASLDQMGAAVGALMKYAELSASMTEETSYYLKVVLSELITNSLKHGGAKSPVKVEVDVAGSDLVVTVDDGGHGFDTSRIGLCADLTSESGRGLAIVKGLCKSLETNPTGNRVRASLALQ